MKWSAERIEIAKNLFNQDYVEQPTFIVEGEKNSVRRAGS